MTCDRDPAAGKLQILGVVGLVLFVAAAFTPLVNALNAWMGDAPELRSAEAIVVLGRGGADPDGVLTNSSLRRTLHGVALHRQRLAPLLVLSGSADEVAARVSLARDLGVPEGTIVAVPGGRTSREEAVRAGTLLMPRGVRRILLVADPVDMPRTRRLFERAGFIVYSAPTAATGPSDPEARLALLRDICLELVAFAYYRLAGFL